MSNTDKPTTPDRSEVWSDRVPLVLSVVAFSAVVIVFIAVGLTKKPVLFNPQTKNDAKWETLAESVLNLQARIDKIEQENQVLFRLLRQENGVIPDSTVPPVSLTPVLPLPRPLGDVLGDVPDGSKTGTK
jgi:hypothetical protein